MNKQDAITTIVNVITDHIEPAEPAESIRKFLAEHDGKLLDKRLIDKLCVAVPGYDIRLRKQYGMTNIEWGGYNYANDPRPGGSLLIGHTTTSVRVDIEAFSRSNVAYYEARQERNAKRQAALGNHQAIVALAEASIKLIEARKALEDLLDGPFEADEYTLEKALGIKEE